MTVTPEELAAYADGELEGPEAARILLAVVARPELMRVVQQHRELRARIGAEFAPILDQEVPERLAALLRPPEEQEERDSRREPRGTARARQDSALLTPPADRNSADPACDTSPNGEQRSEGREPLPHRRWLILAVVAGALAAAATLPGEWTRKAGLPSEPVAAATGGS
jgi:anti-sigma factor RsiW